MGQLYCWCARAVINTQRTHGTALLQVSGDFVYLKGDLNPLMRKKRDKGLMTFRWGGFLTLQQLHSKCLRY